MVVVIICRFSEWVLFAALLAFLTACGVRVSGYYHYRLRSMELDKTGLHLEAKTLQKEVRELTAVLESDMLVVKERLIGITAIQNSITELTQAVDRLGNRIRNRRRELNNNNTH